MTESSGLRLTGNRSSVTLRKIVIWTVLILVTAVQVFPFYWMLSFSLKSNADVYGGNIAGLPGVFHWENYLKALTTGHIGNYLLNSLIVTAVAILVSDLLACMSSYAMIRMKWKGSKSALMFFLVGYMIPMHATLLPLMLILRDMSMLNTRFALILPYIAFALPFAIFLLTGFVSDIPRELEEAACIDGCSVYHLFFSIIIPLLKPAIATISIFTYLTCWNDLLYSMTFINADALKTLTYGIMTFEGQYAVDWGTVGAGLVIATVPTVIMYLLFSKHMQKGLMAGAVKG